MYAGKPPVTDSFEEYTADGIKVYILKDAVTAPEGVKITLSGWGPWRNLQVKGLLH